MFLHIRSKKDSFRGIRIYRSINFIKLTEEDKILYNSAIRVYSSIMKWGGNSIEEIKECIEILEQFEDYEKCKDLLEVFNAYKFRKGE